MNQLRLIMQGVLVALGFIVLAIALPYQSPVARYYGPPFREQTVMEITLPLPGVPPILLGLISLIIFAAVTVALTLYLAGFAPFLKRLATQKRGLATLLVTGPLFLLTMFSGFVNVGFDSLKASSRLTLGLVSIILILANSFSLLRGSDFSRIGDSALTLAWGRAKEWLLTMKPLQFMVVVFLIEFALTSTAAYSVFDRIPHVVDSIAQLFHAKIFAMGKLTVPSPPLPEFYKMVHMISNGQWYSQFPPGNVALLVPGVLLGVPWLVNPLLGSGTVVLIYKLGVELYGEGIGRVSALLALVSPFLLFMSAEMMSHTGAMFFFTLFVLSLVRMLRTRSILPAIIAGCGLGVLVCIRPYTAVGVSLPFLLYGVYSFFKDRRTLALSSFVFVLTTSFFVGLLLLFNHQTNGSPFVFGYQVLWGAGVLPGLGNAGWGQPLTFEQGILNTLDNLLGLQKFMFEWPLPSLLPLAILFWGGVVNRWDKLMLATLGTLTTAYCFYWFQHWLYGPRFLFEVTPFLILLTARGLHQVPEMVRTYGGKVMDGTMYHARTALIVLLCSMVGLAVNIPGLIKEYRGFGFVDRSVLDTVEKKGIRKGVIFTQSNYGGVFPANSPDLKSGNVFVRDLGDEKNRILMESFPGFESFRAFNEVVEPYDPGQVPEAIFRQGKGGTAAGR